MLVTAEYKVGCHPICYAQEIGIRAPKFVSLPAGLMFVKLGPYQ
jgi:hypothetical protein